jgi:hypothetical protein
MLLLLETYRINYQYHVKKLGSDTRLSTANMEIRATAF